MTANKGGYDWLSWSSSIDRSRASKLLQQVHKRVWCLANFRRREGRSLTHRIDNDGRSATSASRETLQLQLFGPLDPYEVACGGGFGLVWRKAARGKIRCRSRAEQLWTPAIAVRRGVLDQCRVFSSVASPISFPFVKSRPDGSSLLVAWTQAGFGCAIAGEARRGPRYGSNTGTGTLENYRV